MNRAPVISVTDPDCHTSEADKIHLDKICMCLLTETKSNALQGMKIFALDMNTVCECWVTHKLILWNGSLWRPQKNIKSSLQDWLSLSFVMENTFYNIHLKYSQVMLKMQITSDESDRIDPKTSDQRKPSLMPPRLQINICQYVLLSRSDTLYSLSI